MKIPITLVPQGVIPRDPALTVRMRKLPEPEKIVETITNTETIEVPVGGEVLPPGSDVWYDSPDNSVIPFQAYDNAMLGDTSNVGFGTDDAFDNEADIPDFPFSGGQHRSAWWQLTVPDGVSDAVLTVDTWLTLDSSFTAPPADVGTDTNLLLLTTAEAPPLGPLPTAATDFSKLTVVAYSEDDPDPDDPTRTATSKISDIPLTAGKVYWLRVDIYADDEVEPSRRDAVYRLRISLTFTP